MWQFNTEMDKQAADAMGANTIDAIVKEASDDANRVAKIENRRICQMRLLGAGRRGLGR